MHEHGIAQRVYDLLIEKARSSGAGGVKAVTLEVGEFAGVTPDALIAGLEHCCEHHDAPCFEVAVTTVGAAVRCRQCGHVVALAEETPGTPVADDTPAGPRASVRPEAACEQCGGDALELIPATGVRIVRAEFTAAGPADGPPPRET